MKKGENMEFEKGDCYVANFNALMDIEKFDHKEWVMVHALREIILGSEWWGGHAFLYNKKTKMVYDASISARNSNDGKPLNITLEEAVDKWNLKTHEPSMWQEYTRGEMVTKAIDTGHYGSWDLPYENWATMPPANYAEYMKWFQKEYCPTTYKVMQLNTEKIKGE